MASVLRDLRIAARRLRAAPAFTAVAVLTLAFGIGATAAIFTVVEDVLLRPLPFAHPERLVRVTAAFRRLGVDDGGLSPKELFDYRDRAGVFDEIAGVWPITANLTGTSQPERVETLLASPNYFQILGARPQIGRLFGPADYQPGIAPVVVISDGLWRRGFGADPQALGRTLRIDMDVYQIIGVTERDFRHPALTLETDVDVWAPSGWIASPFQPSTHSSRFLPAAIGRLKPGLTLEAARARLETFGAALRRDFPLDYPDRAGWMPRLLPLKEDLIASARPSLLIVMASVVFVLIIACANIANLQLARAAGRAREIAVRRALGASATRVIREQLAESLLLACAGGGAGIVLSLWALDLLLQLAPASLPRRAEVGVDWTVLAFGIAVSLLTALVFGLVPAVQASNPAIQQVLRGTGRASAGRGHARVRRALIMLECAIAVVLLVSGALLVRSFWHLQRVDPGFYAGGVTAGRVWLPQPNDPAQGPYFTQQARARVFRDLLGRLRPFGEAVALATSEPMSGAPLRYVYGRRMAGRRDGGRDRAGHVRDQRLFRHAWDSPRPRPPSRFARRRGPPAGDPGQRNHGANVLAQPGPCRQADPHHRPRWAAAGGRRAMDHGCRRRGRHPEQRPRSTGPAADVRLDAAGFEPVDRSAAEGAG